MKQTPLRGRSTKTAAKEEVRAELRVQWLREAEDPRLGFPVCEAKWDRACQGVAVDAHERISRGRQGSILDRSNVLLICRYCHIQIHAHPAQAKERNLLASKPL